MLEDCPLARVGEFLEESGCELLGGRPRLGVVARFGNSGSMWANFSLLIEIVSVFVPIATWKLLGPGWMTLNGS